MGKARKKQEKRETGKVESQQWGIRDFSWGRGGRKQKVENRKQK